VAVETPRELLEAFAAAVPPALREMAAVEAVVREARPARAADGFADLSAVIRLTAADGERRLVVSFPQRTAAELARRILAGTADEVAADMIGDCVGEVANVVAGQAKALLVGCPSHFTLSTPTVRTDMAEAADGRWLIRFDSDAGEFAVHLCPPRAAGAGGATFAGSGD
jgi:CheY-specific phosphatase CheX